MVKYSLCFSVIIFMFYGSCSIGSDLEGFFHNMGSVTNNTSGGAHHDQAGGYYTGGGFSVRNKTKNAQLGTFQLPNVRSGCGGIDIFTGGFSFISSGELVQALKNIGSNAVSYGFMLAMKTFAPSVQSVISELQDMASKINQTNINSCETASNLMGGMWPKLDATNRHICSSIGSNNGIFKDWAAARQGCGKGRSPDVLSKKNSMEGYKNILGEEFNVAWNVIKGNNYLFADQSLAELCMTISGTIVSYNEGGETRVTTYASKADSEDLIKALFEGGTVETYGCDEKQRCLRVKTKNYQISSNGFLNKVQKTLTDITEKAINDNPLSSEEIAFIEKVRLPLYKMVNVLAAYRRKEFSLNEFTEVICIDLVHGYITEILDVMLKETENLRNAQVSDDVIKKFLRQLREAKSNINMKRKIAYEQMNQALIIIETAKIYEKKLENSFEILQRGKEF